MAKQMITIHNLATGEVIEREMNAEELAQLKVDAQAQAKRDAEQAAKDAAKQAVLNKLGLSADEIALLLGAN